MLAIPSLVPPRTLSLVVRKHRRAAELLAFPVDDLRLGMGWVMAWLRQRTGESAAEVAHQIGLGPQTVRDIEKGSYHDFGWCKAYLICQHLRIDLSAVEDLAKRYLRFDYLRQKKRHKDEPDWKYEGPWSKNRAEEDEDRYIRKNRARYTVFASTARKSIACAHEHDVVLQS